MEDSKKELARNHYKRALQGLEQSNQIFYSGKHRAAVNSSYYAVYDGMRAIHALDNDVGSDNCDDIVSSFNRLHIIGEWFEVPACQIIRNTVSIIKCGVPDNSPEVSRPEAMTQLIMSAQFISYIKVYLINHFIL